MDTSKFSLPGALHVLRPYFEWLSFKPLEVYVNDSESSEAGASGCRRWPKFTTMPACVLLDDRVYAIELHRSPMETLGLDSRRTLMVWRLLVRRELEAWGVCVLQTTRFPPTSWGPRVGISEMAVVSCCDKFTERNLEDDIYDSVKLKRDVFVRKYGPLDLGQTFWKGAQGWTQDSLQPRERAVRELTTLTQCCFEQLNAPQK